MIITEISWDQAADPSFGADRAAWREAVGQVAAKAQEKLPAWCVLPPTHKGCNPACLRNLSRSRKKERQKPSLIPFVRDDGGRQAAGFRGLAGDCVCRAVAIVTERPYREVYDLINQLARDYPRLHDGHSTARNGISRSLIRHLMTQLGLTWTPTMRFGQGCLVHLRAEELPAGRLVVRLACHVAAVVDGTLHDTEDWYLGHCVYGYWLLGERSPQP